MASKLTTWINQKLKAKGTTAKEEKKKAGKYKSISAAKKAGSLYYTDKSGNVMIAAHAEDLNSVDKTSTARPKARPDTVTRSGGMDGDMTVAERKEVDAANVEIKKDAAARRAIKLEEAKEYLKNKRTKGGTDPLNLAGPSAEARANKMNKGGMTQKKGYNKGGLKAAPNKGAKSLPKGVRNAMGYMNAGGMAKKKVMSYNLGGMVKTQVNNLKVGRNK